MTTCPKKLLPKEAIFLVSCKPGYWHYIHNRTSFEIQKDGESEDKGRRKRNCMGREQETYKSIMDEMRGLTPSLNKFGTPIY